MKTWIACASALVLVSACGASPEATQALEAMNIGDGKTGIIQFASKSASGDKVTLKDVVVGAEQGGGLKAKTMILGGLDVTSDGQPMVATVTLNDISLPEEVPGLAFALKTVTIENASEPVARFLAASFTEAGPGDPPPFEQWKFDKISINGLDVKGDLAAMGAGGGSFTVTMDELSASKLSDTIFGAAKFAGLKGAFDIPAEAGAGFPIVGKYDFGVADISNLRGGLFVDAFMAGYSGAATGDAEAIQQAQIDTFAKMTSPIDPGYDKITWTPVAIEASGAKLTTSRMEQTVSRDANGVATKIKSPRMTMAFAADSSGGQLGAMAAAGLGMAGFQNTLELYAEADASHDPATDTTRYEKYTFGLTDGFDLEMKGGMQGLKDAIVSLMGSMTAMSSPYGMAEAPDMSGLQAMKIVDLDVTLTDKSIVQKMLSLAPMMGAPDAETMRADLVSMVSAMGPDLTNAGVDAAVANELSAAVADFIRQSGKLHIVMKPAAPVALAAPGATLTKDTLGFSATYTPN